MSTTFPIRGLDQETVERLDTAARARGMSRNAYVVDVLRDHVRQVRPRVDSDEFRAAAALARDLGDADFRRFGWR